MEGKKNAMKKENIYLSTIAADAADIAKEYGLGLEIAEYCTAWNMDEEFPQTDAAVLEKLTGIGRCVLHAPFNELFPCAIDKKARALACERYRQAIDIAKGYGATKVVIHGGYNPRIYYPEWYVEQSVLFWKEFLKEDPGVQIVVENVLEDNPDLLLDIIKGVNDPRLKLCLDLGHVNAYSEVPVMDWLVAWAPYISHFHIHNNDGSSDSHNALNSGTIPVKNLLLHADHMCPNATYTLELLQNAQSVHWLKENELL